MFDLGKSELKPAAFAQLHELTQFLSDNPRSRAKIYGHTDDLGSDDENWLLSEKRAKAVFDFLIKENVAMELLTFKGLGENKPLVENKSETARAMNRRVEVEIHE